MRWSALPTLVVLALIPPFRAVLAQDVRAPSVRYDLQASVADDSGIITGRARIRYGPSATDTIQSLTLVLGYNSFRPGARDWPRNRKDAAEASGYHRIDEVAVDGVPVRIEWPHSPDSAAARLILPRAVAAGDSAVITLRWEARPPALAWRLQRRARRVDLIGWYPLVLDELSGTPVISPAMSTHHLELDLADDQVIGGTGVVLCGDPGWQRAAASATTLVTLRPDPYPPHADVCGDGAAPGRRRMIWYAEGVTELVFALSPSFRYEEGNIFEKPVRALYEAGHERSWGAGLATRRAEAALAWTVEIGGRFPWPHATVIQAMDDTRAALPMVLLTGESSQSALLHLVGLMISQQMLLGGSRVFTVGSAAFQTTWFFETLGRRGDYEHLEREILDWDLDGLGREDEPLPRSTSPCNSTHCRRTEFLQHQLRSWADDDEAVRNIYRTVIERYLLKPTVPGGFMAVSRELISPDPAPLYAQLPTGRTLYDDAVGNIRRERMSDGHWRTTVVVERHAPGRFPQTVWVVAAQDTAAARAIEMTDREVLSIVTRTEPKRVILDPLVESHDWNMLNNQRSFDQSIVSRLIARVPKDKYLDTYFSRRSVRDRLTEGYAPTVWYNDVAGWTYGLRVRQDYLGRFELNEAWASLGTARDRRDFNAQLRLRNPVWLRAAGWTQSLELARLEGRAAGRLDVARRFRNSVRESTVPELGAGVQWLSVTDPAYVDARSWDDAGTAEMRVHGKLAGPRGAPLIELSIGGGHAYANAAGGAAADYVRSTLTAATRREVGAAWTVGARAFGAAVSDDAPRQRRISIAGADPYQQFGNPFLRSRGALFARPGFFYHDPGGAGVRLVEPHVSSTRVVGASAEIEYAPLRANWGLLRRGAVAGFADGARGNGDISASGRMAGVGNAGVGIRLDYRIGSTSFQTRLDAPLWRSRPGMRGWTFSFVPAF